MLVLGAAILVPVSLGLARVWGPQCSTMYLHYNLQYRAGDLQVENTILNESLREMLVVMGAHPNWHYTVELQSYAIERLVNEPAHFPGVLEMLQEQQARGQLGIICGVYSSQVVSAYPRRIVDWSFDINKEIMDAANLTQSRAIIHQEGQVTSGLALAYPENNNTRVDTVIMSKQQIHDFWPGMDPTWEQPVQRLTLNGRTINLLVYDYLPRWEAGYWHGWTWTMDAELAIEKEGGEYEFQVDPARVRNWEQQYEAMERHGVTFMTVEEWIDHCEREGYVEDLPHYQPTTHWGPTMYDTCFRWYGDNNGNVDDGAMLAMNYRTQNLLRATEVLNQTYGHLLNASAKARVVHEFRAAARSIILASVTDTTGITPRPIEREFGYNHSRWAVQNCSSITRKIQWELTRRGIAPEVASAAQLQVDLTGRTIEPDPAQFSRPAAVESVTGDQLNASFPFDIRAEASISYGTITTDIDRVTLFDETAFRYNLTFPGTNDWGVDAIDGQSLDASVWFEGPAGSKATNLIAYPVSLAESLMVRLKRSDYTPNDVLKFHLPVSSGLLFLPDGPTSAEGQAIVWNCSTYHLAPRWYEDALRFITLQVHLDATFQFYLLPNVTQASAQAFANRLNTNAPVILSGEPSLVGGNEYFVAYAACAGGEAASGDEWWN